MADAPRIAVVGSANVDLTTFTDDFPRPGETIFGNSFDLGFGGKGANQAVAARICGAEVSMVARVGQDLFGSATVKNFDDLGIDSSHVHITEGVSSGVAPIFVDAPPRSSRSPPASCCNWKSRWRLCTTRFDSPRSMAFVPF
jgi:ribokinase